MPIIPFTAFQVECDICGTLAPAAFDTVTAVKNAVTAGFVNFKVPPAEPKTGQDAYECPACLQAANAATVPVIPAAPAI